MKIKFAKTKPNAIIPSKEKENAGYDIYACFDEDYILIPAHKTKLIPTGIASAFDDGYYIQLEERGSTGSKGIKRSAGVIDSGYRGEWFVAITNTNDVDLFISKIDDIELRRFKNNYNIYPYTKAIAQAIVHIVPESEVEEISYDELQKIPSKRGNGALGSSGK